MTSGSNGMLGVLAESYDPDSARAELALWTTAHGGPKAARELLVQAVRETPFRTRAEAMLDVLAGALPEPEGERLLHQLRGGPELAPTALSVLTRREFLDPDDLVDAEAFLTVAENLLQFLESTGEGTIRAGHGAPWARPGSGFHLGAGFRCGFCGQIVVGRRYAPGAVRCSLQQDMGDVPCAARSG